MSAETVEGTTVWLSTSKEDMEIWIELVTLKPQMPICRSREKAPQTVSSWVSKALRPKYINLIINKKKPASDIYSHQLG